MPLFGPPNFSQLEEKKDINKLIKLLKSKDFDISWDAAISLIRIGEPSVIPCIKLLQNDSDKKYHYMLSIVLPNIGEPSIAPLNQLLQANETRIKKYAISILGLFQDPMVVEPLLSMLHDPDPDCRKAAIWHLKYCADERVVEPLLNELDNKEALPEIILALGASRDQRIIKPLSKFLTKDTPVELIRNSIIALGKTGDPTVIDLIMKVKESEIDFYTTLPEKIDALAEIGTIEAVSALAKIAPLVKEKRPWYKNHMEIPPMKLAQVYDSSPIEKMIILGMKPELNEFVAKQIEELNEMTRVNQMLLNYAISTTSVERLVYAKELLGEDREAIILPLAALMEHPVREIRSSASSVLGVLAKAQFKYRISILLTLLKDKNSRLMRMGAAGALGTAKTQLSLLKLALAVEKDPEVRKVMDWAVNQFN